MRRWTLDYWKSSSSTTSSVRKDLLKVLKDRDRAKEFLKLVRGLEEFGPLGYDMPHNKSLGGGLFELRDRKKHTRYYYCEAPFSYQESLEILPVLLLLVVGDNKDRQQHAIEMAIARMKKLGPENGLNDEGRKILEG